MDKREQITEVIAAYRKHGWELRRVLLTRETLAATSGEPTLLESLPVRAALIDALWFSRPSHDKREAWELRLVAETPYALFEAFEADETEEQREEARLEMEARMREYVSQE